MKKIIVLICCLLGMWVSSSAWGCSALGPERGWYMVQDGQLSYKPYRSQEYRVIDGADSQSVSYVTNSRAPIEYENRTTYFSDYVSDKNHVYYEGRVLEGADPSQVVFLEQYFNQVVLIDGLDDFLSDETRNKEGGYLVGGRVVYYYGRLLEGANGESFSWMQPYGEERFFGRDYARDDQHIYLYGQVVAGDAQTAREIGYGYYLDAQHIYFRGEVLEGALPEDFEFDGVFIISNGAVYYRAQQLEVDAGSFETIKYIDGNPFIACGGTTFAGVFVKDHNGVYALFVTGEFVPLTVADDVDVAGVYVYREYVSSGVSFYRDGEGMHYFFDETSKNSGSLEGEFSGDSTTFEAYAILTRAVIFRDSTGFYISRRSFMGSNLSKVVRGDAQLVCLEEDHLCLLSDHVLYRIFADGTVRQEEVEESYSVGVEVMSELEERRIQLLNSTQIRREPQLINDKLEERSFRRIYIL